MASKKTYPPKFVNTLIHPAEYNLEKLDVFKEAELGKYFNVKNLPPILSFGKHYFTISYNDPSSVNRLREKSQILFEFKDSKGLVIYSDLTTLNDINGAAVGYVWLKKDPIKTYKEISEGKGTMTIVAELESVPVEWQDIYNVRTTIPIEIRKDYPNTSPLLLQDTGSITMDVHEEVLASTDAPNIQISYAFISASNLTTYGGKIEQIEVSYLVSGSTTIEGSGAEYPTNFMLCGYHRLSDENYYGVGAQQFENDIHEDYAHGLNPVSKKFRIPINVPHQSSSVMDVQNAQVKFRFRFLSSKNEYAQDITTNQVIQLTSSFQQWEGAPWVALGGNNLMGGQMYVGNAVGTGFEFSGGSAFLRTVGYLGFSSASKTELPSGFMMWSGSVLTGTTDDYSTGGVGMEMVTDSSSYFRFRTNPSELDIRAQSFYVGSETSQFISGAGGNIEISSSGFHLDTENNFMEIAGWTLHRGSDGRSLLSGSNITLDATGSSLYKSDTPPGTTNGYFIDFTPGDQSTDNDYYIRMGPHFAVSQSGQLFASGARIEGTLTAVDGVIGDWQIIDGKLSGSNATLDASSSAFYMTSDPQNYFIDFTPEADAGMSAASNRAKYYVKFGPNFAVSSSGVLIASGAIIEGTLTAVDGVIGGFLIDSHSIYSVNGNMFISGSPQNNGTDHFIYTPNFNIKGNGDVTGSQVLFTGGKIAGATISDTELKYGSNWLISASAQSNEYFISSSNFQVMQSGQITASAGKVAGWKIEPNKLSTTGFEIATQESGEDFILSSSHFQVDQFGNLTASNAYIIGTITSSVIISETGYVSGWSLNPGYLMDGTGRFKLEPAGPYVISSSNFQVTPAGDITGSQVLFTGGKISGSNMDIQVSQFELDTDGVDISTTNQTLKVGSSDLSLSAGSGSFLSGSGEFKLGDDSSYIKFENDNFTIAGADLDINVTDLHISASGFSLSSTEGSMSIGDNREIVLDKKGGTAGVPIIKIDGGEISASNFFVSAQGQMTASAGKIAGWDIDSNTIYNSNITMSNANGGYISLNDDSILLSGSGEGQLAGGAIYWNTLGDLTIAADVEFKGRSGLKTIFFEDWSQYADGSALTGSGDNPKTDGSGQGWFAYINEGSSSLETGQGSVHTADRVLKTGDDLEGQISDWTWWSSNQLIAFNSQSLYEIEIRIKKTEGDHEGGEDDDGFEFVGVTCFNADGTTKVNTDGIDSYHSQHYFTLQDYDVPNDETWRIYKGFFKGRQGRIPGAAGGVHPTITDPGVVASGSGGDDVKYFAPMFIANHYSNTGADGIAYIDYIRVSEYQTGGGGTKISGDNIQTGKIKSNNWSNLAGSEINLQDGTFKLGGYDNPDLEFDGSTLTVSGTISSSVGNIGGWTIDGAKLKKGTDFELAPLSTYIISSSNFKVDSSGDITGSQVLFIGGKIAGWDIVGNTISSSNVKLNSYNNNGEITLGSASGLTVGGDGIYMNGNGVFRAGGNASDFIKWDGSNISISSSNFSLNYGNISASGGTIAGATISDTELKYGSNWSISASAQQDEYFISSSKFNVKQSGNITGSQVLFTGGKISGWDINDGKLSFGDGTMTEDNSLLPAPLTIQLQTGSKASGYFHNWNSHLAGLSLTWNYEDNAGHVVVGQIAASSQTLKDGFYGIQMMNDSSKEYFVLSADASGSGFSKNVYNRIAGWAFDENKLYNTNNTFYFQSTDGGGLWLGAEAYDDAGIALSGSGEGFLAGGAIAWDKGGDLTVSGTLSASIGNIGGWTIDGAKLKKGTDFELAPLSTYIISSSNFKVDSTGNITGSQVLFTGGKITGSSVDIKVSQLHIDTTTFDVTTDDGGKITLGSSDEILLSGSGEGQLAGGAVSWNKEGTLVVSGTLSSSIGNIGGWTIDGEKLKKGTDFELAPLSSYVISSSRFKVNSSGDVTGSQVLFTGGKIAEFTIAGNTLSSSGFILDATDKSISLGSGNAIFIVDADSGLQLGNAAFASAPFSVTEAGVLKAELGTIAGWDIDANKISSGNLQMYNTGVLQTSDFASGVTGWKIDSANNGFAEFENVRIRGTMATVVFEKESVNAVGGQLFIANSTTITGSGVTAADTTMSVVNVTGFTGSYDDNGEVLAIKKFTTTGFATEYVMVQSSSRTNSTSQTDFSGKLYVKRGLDSGLSGNEPGSEYVGDAPSSATAYSASQVIVSTGRSGTGYIRLNANPSDTATPYIDIVERTGSGAYDVKLQTRLGDLSGLVGNSVLGGNTDPGYGLMAENVFLSGRIDAQSGEIGDVKMTSGSITVGEGWMEGWTRHKAGETGFVSKLVASMSGQPIIQPVKAVASLDWGPPSFTNYFGTNDKDSFQFTDTNAPATSSYFIATSSAWSASVVDNLSNKSAPVFFFGTGSNTNEYITNLSEKINQVSESSYIPIIANALLSIPHTSITSSLQLTASYIGTAGNNFTWQTGSHHPYDWTSAVYPAGFFDGGINEPIVPLAGDGDEYEHYAGFFVGYDTGSSVGQDNYISNPGEGFLFDRVFKFGVYGGSPGSPEFLIFDGENMFLQGAIETVAGGTIAHWDISEETIYKNYGEYPRNMVQMAGASDFLADYYNPGDDDKPNTELSASAIEFLSGKAPAYLPLISVHDQTGRVVGAMGHFESQSLGIYGIAGKIGSWELHPTSMSKSQGFELSDRDPNEWPKYHSNWTGSHPYATQSRRMSLGSTEAPIMSNPIYRPGQPRQYGEDEFGVPAINIAVTHSKYFKIDWDGDVEVGDDLSVGEWIRHLGDNGSWNPDDHLNEDFVNSGSFLKERFGADSHSFYNPNKLYTGIQFPSDQWEMDFQVGGMDVMELKGPSRGMANEPSYSAEFLAKTGSCNWKLNDKNWDPPNILFGFPVGAPTSQSMYITHDEIRMLPGRPEAAPNSSLAAAEGLIQMYARLEIISHSLQAWWGDEQYPGYTFDGKADTGMFILPYLDGSDLEETLAFSVNGRIEGNPDVRGLHMLMQDNKKTRFFNEEGDETFRIDGDAAGGGKLQIFDNTGASRFEYEAMDGRIQMQNVYEKETIQIETDQIGDSAGSGKITLKRDMGASFPLLREIRAIQLDADELHIEMFNSLEMKTVEINSNVDTNLAGVISLGDSGSVANFGDVGDYPLITIAADERKILLYSSASLDASGIYVSQELGGNTLPAFGPTSGDSAWDKWDFNATDDGKAGGTGWSAGNGVLDYVWFDNDDSDLCISSSNFAVVLKPATQYSFYFNIEEIVPWSDDNERFEMKGSDDNSKLFSLRLWKFGEPTGKVTQSFTTDATFDGTEKFRLRADEKGTTAAGQYRFSEFRIVEMIDEFQLHEGVDLEDYATVFIDGEKGHEEGGRIILREKDSTNIIKLDADERKIEMQTGGGHETIVINSDTSNAGKISIKSENPVGNGNIDSITLSAVDHKITMYSGSASSSANLVITSASIGIGTTSPSGSLHVVGEAWITKDTDNGLRIRPGLPYGYQYGFADNSNYAIAFVNEQGVNNQAIVLGDSGTTSTGILFGVSNRDSTGDPSVGNESGWSASFAITGQGNVGIGTPTPDSKLDVIHDFSVSNTDWDGGTAGSRFRVQLDSTSGDTGATILMQDVGGTSNNDLTMLPYTGRVIIGADNQHAAGVKLHVYGDIKIDNETDVDTNAYYGIYSNQDINLKIGSAAGSEARMYLYGINNGESTSGSIYMAAANQSNQLFLDATDGNVGIGNTNPPEALTVEGTISSSGGIELDGGDSLPDGGDRVRLGATAAGGTTTGSLQVSTRAGYAYFGPRNLNWNHITTDRPAMYFNVAGSGMYAFNAGSGGDVTLASYDNKDLILRRDQQDGNFDQIAIHPNSMSIKLGGTDRLVIDGSGNVGIGTPSPSALLMVRGTGENNTGGPTGGTDQVQIMSDVNGYAAGIGFTSHLTGGNTWADANQHGYLRFFHGDGALPVAGAGFYMASDNGAFSLTLTGSNASTYLYLGTSQIVGKSGNVGIGTTDPDVALHVVNGADGNTANFFGSADTTTRFTINVHHADQMSSLFSYDESGTPAYNKLRVGHGSDSSKALVVDPANKRVGIGTDSPDTTLVVATGSGAPYVSIQMKVGSDTGMSIGVDGSNNSLKIGDSYNPTSNTHLTILQDGNVGIGLTNPGYKLHISESTGTAGLVVDGGYSGVPIAIFKRIESGTGRGQVQINSSGYDPQIRFDDDAGQKYSIGLDAGTNKFSIGTGSAVDGTEAFTVDTSGQVGIGTTSPDEMLTVMGFEKDAVIHITVDEDPNGDAAGNAILKFSDWDDVANQHFKIEFDTTTEDLRFRSNSTDNILYLDTLGNVGIGLNAPSSFKLQVAGAVGPDADNSYDLGSSTKRWQDVYSVSTTTGAVFESGLKTEGLKGLPTGTIVTWKDGKCVPCYKAEDELVMGVTREGKDEPIVLGAEPVLVTGKVNEGDYIVTSDKEGHGKSIDVKKNLYGKVIGQALESSKDDSDLIKCMIRKM